MTTYTVGARVFCDFWFGGKPLGVVTAVLKPGDGRRGDGLVRVRITKSQSSAYPVGEEHELKSSIAVPVKQECRMPGSCLRWVNTDYQFTKPQPLTP